MGTARRFRASRGHRYPITVRPTNVDIAVAREIAGDTAPAPEQIARADLGRRRKGTSRSRGGRLASLSRPREGPSPRWQPRRAGRGCGRATAARDEAPVQSDPSGPQDRDWPRSRYLFFRRARGRVSVRPCVAHGSAGLGRRHVAHSTPLGDPSVRDWALADASSSSGALGERRCRGIRSRSHSRYPLDSAKEDARANTGKP